MNNQRNIIITGVVIVIILVLGLIILMQVNKNSNNTSTTNTTTTNNPDSSPINTSTTSGLVIQDIKTGTGNAVVNGNTLSVNYIGTLTDGTKFDSSYDRNQPFSFVIGQGNVIQGWDQGMLGMKVGGKRKLTIPANLGYGNQPAGSIPPNSTLIFEVELLGIK